MIFLELLYSESNYKFSIIYIFPSCYKGYYYLKETELIILHSHLISIEFIGFQLNIVVEM